MNSVTWLHTFHVAYIYNVCKKNDINYHDFRYSIIEIIYSTLRYFYVKRCDIDSGFAVIETQIPIKITENNIVKISQSKTGDLLSVPQLPCFQNIGG